MLGDFADKAGVIQHAADYLTSVPYRVSSINSSKSVETILMARKAPVLWEYYPFWGRKPETGLAFPDGKLRYAIHSWFRGAGK